MHQHRFAEHVENYHLPEPRVVLSADGFMACPVLLLQSVPWHQLAWQNEIYQLAFQQTQAELRPSLPERDLLAVWN
jgi:hypothetical protein